MDLKKAIEAEHSRRQAERIADWVQQDPKRLTLLWEQVRDGKPPVPQRGAYAMTVLHDRDKKTWEAFVPAIIRHLEQGGFHNAVYRNLFRTLGDLPLPEDEDLQGGLLETSFEVFNSAESAIAIKIFSMDVLCKHCLAWPDLKNELHSVITLQLPYGSTGFCNHARKVLKKLEKL